MIEIINWYATRRHLSTDRRNAICSPYTVGADREAYEHRKGDTAKRWDDIPLCKLCVKKAKPSDMDAAAAEWLADYHGGIDSGALLLAFKAGYRIAEAQR